MQLKQNFIVLRFKVRRKHIFLPFCRTSEPSATSHGLILTSVLTDNESPTLVDTDGLQTRRVLHILICYGLSKISRAGDVNDVSGVQG